MDITETRYSVRGMKCSGCIAKATAALSVLPGYVSAEFNLKAGVAVIKGDIDPQAAMNALAKAGYPAQQMHN